MDGRQQGRNAENAESPDFGNDEAGKIAAFVYRKRRTARYAVDWIPSAREQTKTGEAARKRIQRAYRELCSALDDDPELCDWLTKAGLLSSIEMVGEILTQPAVYASNMKDAGGRPPAITTVLMWWVIDEFYPDWVDSPPPVGQTSRTLNEAFNRAGIIDTDKTETIRVSLQNHLQKAPASQKYPPMNWNPPKL